MHYIYFFMPKLSNASKTKTGERDHLPELRSLRGQICRFQSNQKHVGMEAVAENRDSHCQWDLAYSHQPPINITIGFFYYSESIN